MKPYLQYSLFIIFVFFTVYTANAQFTQATSKWKAMFAVGLNMPSSSGFIDEVPSKSVNLPTVNLGLQHMLNRYYGVRLDFGFNRFRNDEKTPDFKVNYSRINTQFVYDPSSYLSFLPQNMRTLIHAGPGISFAKPLGALKANKQTYANLLGGLEWHYALSRKVAVYTDLSYIYGLTRLEEYQPSIKGLAAFNGNVFTLTFGVSISLSGCQFCN